jgi:HAD superfamily hydrolase (TIGR01549 family)
MGLTAADGPVWEAMQRMSPERRKQTEQILHCHEQKGVDESELNEGARDTLNKLRQRGIKIGILTRNLADNARAVEAKHNLTFDEVVGREDGPVKPDAFGVVEICKRFAVAPAETLMVGDYLFDLQCARDAGALAVLIANHPQAEHFAEQADYKIDRISEILEIIRENEKR